MRPQAPLPSEWPPAEATTGRTDVLTVQRTTLYELAQTLSAVERDRFLALASLWLALDADSRVLLESLALRLKPAL